VGTRHHSAIPACRLLRIMLGELLLSFRIVDLQIQVLQDQDPLPRRGYRRCEVLVLPLIKLHGKPRAAFHLNSPLRPSHEARMQAAVFRCSAPSQLEECVPISFRSGYSLPLFISDNQIHPLTTQPTKFTAGAESRTKFTVVSTTSC
jgi:hypothetical protein